jgi:hypothetical protein
LAKGEELDLAGGLYLEIVVVVTHTMLEEVEDEDLVEGHQKHQHLRVRTHGKGVHEVVKTV